MTTKWTLRDIMRIAHPHGINPAVGEFILRGTVTEEAPEVIRAFAKMQEAKSVDDVLSVLSSNSLPWETIPTQFLNDRAVWEALFDNHAIGQTALLRNVVRMEKIGAFKSFRFAKRVSDALSDIDRIVVGRMHPVAYANALGMYNKGITTPVVAGALEDGFYASFKTVEPANKATMLAVDVSSSMTWGAPAGLVGMNYLEAAAVMAMVTVRTEPYTLVTAFDTKLERVNVSPNDSFRTVLYEFSNRNFGGTDVAAPMVYAKNNNLDIDTFIVYSDMETWAGDRKPFQALADYRKSSGVDARLVAVGLAGTKYSVADPKDKGSLNVVGFDSAAPRVIADFSAGRL